MDLACPPMRVPAPAGFGRGRPTIRARADAPVGLSTGGLGSVGCRLGGPVKAAEVGVDFGRPAVSLCLVPMEGGLAAVLVGFAATVPAVVLVGACRTAMDFGCRPQCLLNESQCLNRIPSGQIGLPERIGPPRGRRSP